MAGYSGTPLVKKLGIKPGMPVVVIGAPEGYWQTLGDLPEGVNLREELTAESPFIHFFTSERGELDMIFPELKSALAMDGILWVSWPKKAAKMATDLDENIVREIGLERGLVDVKVAAIDEQWSGLKFVYRVKDR